MKCIALAVLAEKNSTRPCEISEISMQISLLVCKEPFFCVQSWAFCSSLDAPPPENTLDVKIPFTPPSLSETFTTMLEMISAVGNLPVQEFLVTATARLSSFCFPVRMDFFIYRHSFLWTFIYMAFTFTDIQQSYSCQLTAKTVCPPQNISKNWQKHMFLPTMSN